MSNPISNVEDISQDVSQGLSEETSQEIPQEVGREPEPELEVDESFEANALPPILEVDPIEEANEERPSQQENKTSTRMGLVALVLAVLLFGSIALNLQQARVTAALNAESQRAEFALNEAVATLDQETGRANTAESALAGISGAVDTVNDRIESLKQALGDLQEATAIE